VVYKLPFPLRPDENRCRLCPVIADRRTLEWSLFVVLLVGECRKFDSWLHCPCNLELLTSLVPLAMMPLGGTIVGYTLIGGSSQSRSSSGFQAQVPSL